MRDRTIKLTARRGVGEIIVVVILWEGKVRKE
jgi:hypothetical protein